MKKLISILLTLCLSLGIFSVAASAEQTKLEKFVDNLSNAELIYLSVTDEYLKETLELGDIPVKDVEIAVKAIGDTDTAALALKGKVSVFTFHFISTPENTTLYIPTLLCRIDLSKLYDASAYFALGYVLSSSAASSDSADSSLPFLNLESTSTENVEGYGELYCETYTVNLKKAVEDMVASGEITLEEGTDINDMTEEELIELLYSSGMDEETVKLILSTTKAYFDGDEFVGVVFISDGQEIDSFFNGDPITISFNKGEELFKKPFTLFDISWLFPLFLSFI
ncbi:MAG: hypothetical protein IJC37_07435 [Clostridia bacterium]|nr:hypothetical protein [Clostridia bacterium]